MAEVQEEKKEKKSKKGLIIILLLLLLIIGAVCAYIFLRPVEKSRLARDEDALGGLLPGKTPQEIQEILNNKVEEGHVSMGISSMPVFENNGKKGRIGIENVEGNRYSFQVDIVLKDTGETVYSSGLIDPGYYIEYIELSKKLKEGEYPATAIYTTYSLDETNDPIAKTNFDITLDVQDGTYYK